MSSHVCLFRSRRIRTATACVISRMMMVWICVRWSDERRWALLKIRALCTRGWLRRWAPDPIHITHTGPWWLTCSDVHIHMDVLKKTTLRLFYCDWLYRWTSWEKSVEELADVYKNAGSLNVRRSPAPWTTETQTACRVFFFHCKTDGEQQMVVVRLQRLCHQSLKLSLSLHLWFFIGVSLVKTEQGY